MGWGGVKTFVLRCVSLAGLLHFHRYVHATLLPLLLHFHREGGLGWVGSGKQAGAGPLSTLASGGGVFDNFRSSARRPELGDKPSPVPGEKEKKRERERDRERGSRACTGGFVGITLIQGLLSGGEHLIRSLRWRSGGGWGWVE